MSILRKLFGFKKKEKKDPNQQELEFKDQDSVDEKESDSVDVPQEMGTHEEDRDLNLHPKFNKGVTRGKDGRFKSKKS